MRLIRIILAVTLMAAAGSRPCGQQPGEEPANRPDPLFVRVTVYPTWSLSRFDYNNDLDMAEIRSYVELRRGRPEGRILADARVEINGVDLEFREDHYEKRIPVPRDELPASVSIRILVTGERELIRDFPIPGWLVITSPRPDILNADEPIRVEWRCRRFEAPVDIHVYDFKNGTPILEKTNLEENRVVIPGVDIPRDTTLRIYVTGAWFFKKFLSGPELVRGSEIIIMPWSQVFVRTR